VEKHPHRRHADTTRAITQTGQTTATVRAAANGIRYTLLACFLASVIPRSHLSCGSGTVNPSPAASAPDGQGGANLCARTASDRWRRPSWS